MDLTFGFGPDLSKGYTIGLNLSTASASEIALFQEQARIESLALDKEYALDSNKMGAYALESKFEVDVDNKIGAYLQGNILIAKCLKSDAFVSKPIREKILNEMLMPRKEEE